MSAVTEILSWFCLSVGGALMIIGGIGLISFYFIGDPKLLMISMIGVGIAWASILSLPYSRS